jgi:transaldolase
MPSKLDQLKAMTTVVADTGDVDAIRRFGAVDATTNPTLILKAAHMPNHARLLEETVLWGREHNRLTSEITDRLALKFGLELAEIVPGRVSTEVDADLSFDMEGTTWEGIRAAEILQSEGIDCNMTLAFSLAQAAACADAGVFLISPFVGRILDWYSKAEGKSYTAETDPGVVSVWQIYNYYKAHGIETGIMGASFRNQGEIEALAGCDRLTISPQLLEELSRDMGDLPRRLDPSAAASNVPAKLSLDEKSFRFMLNEDAMATEKLAEGIRVFARDLRALREQVSKRLQEAASREM